MQINDEIFKAKKKVYAKSVLGIDTARCKILLYDVAWSQIHFGCLVLEKNSVLLECAARVRVFKLQDADHERDADQTNPTCAQ